MSYNPEDERLDSVESYVREVRTLLLDRRKPYRYSDSEILTALNTSLAEARRLRADLFVYRHGIKVPWFDSVSATPSPLTPNSASPSFMGLPATSSSATMKTYRTYGRLLSLLNSTPFLLGSNAHR